MLFAPLGVLTEIALFRNSVKSGKCPTLSQNSGKHSDLPLADALLNLLREAPFLYSTDFRTGMNIVSRGALMVTETDERIRTKTEGRKACAMG